MDTWTWLAAYLLAFGALQVALYQYFQRQSSPDSAAGATEASGRSLADPSPAEAAEAVRCRHCGSLNDRHPRIRFCRECVGSLH